MSTWVCKRQSAGRVCLTVNDGRKQRCQECGGIKPKRARPKHLVALEQTYEQYVELNGGERCGICHRPPVTRRLDRDHCHKTGRPRGLLCPRCNRALPHWITSSWLRAAADYLERHEGHAA